MNYYKIADMTVAMDTFGRTLQQAQPYQIEYVENPEITIADACHRGKKIHPEWDDDLCEYLYSGMKFYRELLKRDGMMLHASCVVVDGLAYLFTANSGTGKSTHTGLWLEHFGDRAFILNDDKPAIRRENGKWYAYGTPWSGKHDISRNSQVPIAGIAVIERAARNSICPLAGVPAIHAVLRQVNRPRAKEFREMLLDLLDKLITEVPIWKLQCNMEVDAAQIAYAAMSQKKEG